MKKTIKLSLLSVALLNQLNAKEISLDTITITSATKSEQSIKDVTSNVNVITSEEIQERHYQTVTEALNSVSGISFTSSGGLGKATSVYVRGFDSKRVLVLIDGMRYNDHTGTSGARFEHLMINDIEQIEIVKGAQSGIWGADAAAGVINITTKSAKKGLHASISGEYGSFNTKKYAASASYKEDSYYFKVNTQRVFTDGFSAQAPKGVDLDSLENDAYKNTTTSLKAGFNINETNKIDLLHTIIEAGSQSDKLVRNSDDLQTRIDKANDTRYNTTRRDTFSKINFNHIDTFNELDIYAMESRFNRNYNMPTSSSESNGKATEYGLKSNIKYNEKDFVIIGAEYKTFKHENDINSQYNNQALSITNSNEFNGFIGGKTILTESIRKDNYDKFEDKLTGKIGIKHFHKNIDGLVASANFGTAYSAPTLYELYGPVLYGFMVVGNENLVPESTESYDISLEYKDFKITYFHSEIDNMIDYVSTSIGYDNIDGTSTIKGIELEYKLELTQDILVASNYTYLDAQNSDGEELARRPKHSVNLGIDYYGIQDLHVGAYGEYIGSRYNDANKEGEQTGKYTVVNLIANYDINKNFLVYAKIDNLFDKYYQVVDGYATAPLSGYIGIKANF